jgi:hypothetical protein
VSNLAAVGEREYDTCQIMLNPNFRDSDSLATVLYSATARGDPAWNTEHRGTAIIIGDVRGWFETFQSTARIYHSHLKFK